MYLSSPLKFVIYYKEPNIIYKTLPFDSSIIKKRKEKKMLEDSPNLIAFKDNFLKFSKFHFSASKVEKGPYYLRQLSAN